MRKVFFAIMSSLLLVSCGGSGEYRITEYGKDKSQEELFKEAEGMKGIGVLELGKTKKELEKAYSKYHKETFKSLFKYSDALELKDDLGSLVFIKSEFEPESWNSDKELQTCKYVDYVLSESEKIQVELTFFRDTLVYIDIPSQNRERVASLLSLKYGEGVGMDKIGHNRSTGIVQHERVWESETVRAKWHYKYESPNGSTNIRDSFWAYDEFRISRKDESLDKRIKEHKDKRLHDAIYGKEEDKAQAASNI